MLGVVETGDRLDVVGMNRTFRRSFIATAQVDAAYDGRSLDVPVRYDNPETGESPAVTMHLDRYDLAPRASTKIAVEVSADDPANLRPAGSARGPGELITAEVVIAAIFVVSMIALRLQSIRRTRRLVTDGQPSFVMHGRLIGRRRARRPLLQLFALDATPGSEPTCAVPIVSHGSMAIGGSLEPIEVKGWPRPFGAVVARRDTGEVLWPAARALALRFGTRPAERQPPAVVRAATAHHDARVADPIRASDSPVRLVSVWRQMTLELALLVGSVGVAAAVIPITIHNADAADAVRRRSVRTVALVVSHGDEHNTLRFEWNGRTVEAVAPADPNLAYVIGIRYPVMVDPVRPTSVRMAKEPYNTVGPIAWALFIAGLLAIWPLRRFVQRWEARSVLRAGPQQQMEATEVCVTTRFVGIRLRAPDDEPGAERGLVLLPRSVTFNGARAEPVTVIGSMDAHERPLVVVGSTAYIPVTRMFFGRPLTARDRSGKRGPVGSLSRRRCRGRRCRRA